MVASKNFKRNKKRYRATVISLFVSIVLFISTSSFCEYFKDMTMAYSNHIDCDISYYLVPDKNLDPAASEKRMQMLFSGLAGVPGVTASSYSKSLNTQRFLIPLKDLNREFVAFQKEQGRMETISTAKGDFAVIQVSMIFIDDSTFRTYCNEIGVDAEFYLQQLPWVRLSTIITIRINVSQVKYLRKPHLNVVWRRLICRKVRSS